MNCFICLVSGRGQWFYNHDNIVCLGSGAAPSWPGLTLTTPGPWGHRRPRGGEGAHTSDHVTERTEGDVYIYTCVLFLGVLFQSKEFKKVADDWRKNFPNKSIKPLIRRDWFDRGISPTPAQTCVRCDQPPHSRRDLGAGHRKLEILRKLFQLGIKLSKNAENYG